MTAPLCSKIVWGIFLGDGFGFWWVVWCMMPMGPGWSLVLVLGLLPRRFSIPTCGGLRGSVLEFSLPPGGAHRIFSLSCNQGAFFFMYFVNLSQESIFISLRFRRLYFGLISSSYRPLYFLHLTLNKVDYIIIMLLYTRFFDG